MIGKKVWKSLEFTNKNMTGVSTHHGFSCVKPVTHPEQTKHKKVLKHKIKHKNDKKK